MLELAKHIPPLIFGNRLTELTYFTTDSCNMKCRHCFVSDALNRKTQYLPMDDIRRMSQYIPAMQRVHLGGGEPFTRSDIAELAVEISNNWRAGVVCIPTNGWFTDRIIEGMSHFGEKGVGNLRLFFSINSADPEEMDRFTQLRGSFKRWRRSIAKALELTNRYPQITVVALATFNEHNQSHFKSLIDFVHKDVGVEDFSFHIARTHPGYAPRLDMEAFREANEYYFRTYNRQNPVLAGFRQRIRERNADYFENPVFQRTCSSGKLRAVMSPDGDVYPCEKLGYPNLQSMAAWRIGNIRDFNYDLNSLMHSPKARAMYQQICSGNCHCDHNIDQSLSLLSTNGFRLAVVKDAARALMGSRPTA